MVLLAKLCQNAIKFCEQSWNFLIFPWISVGFYLFHQGIEDMKSWNVHYVFPQNFINAKFGLSWAFTEYGFIIN